MSLHFKLDIVAWRVEHSLWFPFTEYVRKSYTWYGLERLSPLSRFTDLKKVVIVIYTLLAATAELWKDMRTNAALTATGIPLMSGLPRVTLFAETTMGPYNGCVAL